MVQLFINGLNDTIGEITLYGDEPISLNISTNDIKDISTTNDTFSKQFTIPADKNNNILLNHIFNIGADSSFDARKKTPCYLLNNNLPVFTGNFQLTQINVKNTNVLSYSCIMYGEKINLVKTLGSKYLVENLDPKDDLDFSNLNHPYTTDSIINSWSADTASTGYYYPLIDYGYDLNAIDLFLDITPGTLFNGVPAVSGGLDPNKLKPAISAKYLFDKIITDNGFSYQSTFLNKDIFKETIIPYNGINDLNLSDTYRQRFEFQAGIVGQTPTLFDSQLVNQIPNRIYNLNFQNTTTLGNYDNSNLYTPNHLPTPGTFLNIGWYTPNKNLGMKFAVDMTVEFNNITVTAPKIVRVYFVRSSLSTNSGVYDFVDVTINNPIPATSYKVFAESKDLNDPYSTTLYPTLPGENIYVRIALFGGVNTGNMIIKEPSYFYNTILNKQIYGADIEMNEYVPKKIKQIDYIKSIINMFNLMVIPDKNNPKRLIFEPRKEYYAAGTIKNWTDKVDHSAGIEETLLSQQQNKQILFTYKEDKDFYNTDYTEKTDKIYGEYTEDIDNEWIEGIKKIEVIFSPTPVDKVLYSNVYVPKICSKDNTGAFAKTESNIRFLRKNKTLMPTNNTFKLLDKPALNAYPYCGHLDNPILSNVDYNFGSIQYSYYSELKSITPNNLVYTYWREYLDDISDKNSKLIKLKIKLTHSDIEQFNYNDNIFIDRLTDDGGCYFIVNKITYAPTDELPSTVELIKINRKPKENRILTDIPLPPLALAPISTVALGNGTIKSRNSMSIGTRNFIGNNSENTFIIGNDTIVNDNTPNVVSINSGPRIIKDADTVFINGVQFNPNGSYFTLYDLEDGGEDIVLNPFTTTPYNLVEGGQDVVRGIGGVSSIMLSDSGQDTTFRGM